MLIIVLIIIIILVALFYYKYKPSLPLLKDISIKNGFNFVFLDGLRTKYINIKELRDRSNTFRELYKLVDNDNNSRIWFCRKENGIKTNEILRETLHADMIDFIQMYDTGKPFIAVGFSWGGVMAKYWKKYMKNCIHAFSLDSPYVEEIVKLIIEQHYNIKNYEFKDDGKMYYVNGKPAIDYGVANEIISLREPVSNYTHIYWRPNGSYNIDVKKVPHKECDDSYCIYYGKERIHDLMKYKEIAKIVYDIIKHRLH